MALHIAKSVASNGLCKKIIPGFYQPAKSFYAKPRIGKREVVGYGINGDPIYFDRTDFPMPAIRFQEPSAEIMKLREKEKGDWKKLTMDEKKALYRASFCQTFAEMKAPTGDWKPIVAGVCVAMGLTLWVYLWLKTFVYPPLPDSLTPESKAAQLQRMIDLKVNPIEGVSSKWDYEKGRWKE